MENNIPTTEQTAPNLNIYLNNATQQYLRTAARWAKFLALVGFVMIGLMVIIGLFLGFIMNMVSSDYMMDQPFPFPPFLFSVIYIILAAILIIPNLYMNSFANKTIKALDGKDEEILAQSISSLKSCSTASLLKNWV